MSIWNATPSALRRGETVDARTLMSLYEGPIRRWIDRKGFGLSVQDREDLLQQTLAGLHAVASTWAALDPSLRHRFRAYLTTTVKNALRNLHRSNRRRPQTNVDPSAISQRPRRVHNQSPMGEGEGVESPLELIEAEEDVAAIELDRAALSAVSAARKALTKDIHPLISGKVNELQEKNPRWSEKRIAQELRDAGGRDAKNVTPSQVREVLEGRLSWRIFGMVLVQELGVKEIARELGLTHSQIKRHVNCARTAVIRALTEAESGVPVSDVVVQVVKRALKEPRRSADFLEEIKDLTVRAELEDMLRRLFEGLRFLQHDRRVESASVAVAELQHGLAAIFKDDDAEAA